LVASAEITSTIILATVRNSAFPKPLVVAAAVPSRIPEVTVGFSESNEGLCNNGIEATTSAGAFPERFGSCTPLLCFSLIELHKV